MSLCLLFSFAPGQEKDLMESQEFGFFDNFSFRYFGQKMEEVGGTIESEYLPLYKNAYRAAKNSEFEESMKLFHNVLMHSNDLQLKCKSYLALGYIWLNNAAYEKAANYFFQGFGLAAHEKDVIDAYCGLGEVYQKLEEYHKSIYHFSKALILCEQTQSENVKPDNKKLDNVKCAQIKVYLAGLYASVFEYKKTEQYLEDAKLIYQDKKMLKEIAQVYSMQAFCSYYQRNFALAIDKLNQAFEIANNHSMTDTAAKLLFQLGVVHLKSGDKKKGMLFLEEAVYQAQIKDDTALEGSILKILGEESLETNDLEGATSFLNKAINNFEREKDYERLEASYEIMVSIYENVGDYKQALTYSKKMAASRWTAYKHQEGKKQQANEISKVAQTISHEKEMALMKKKTELQADLLVKSDYIEHQNQRLELLNDQFRSLTFAAAHSLKEPLRNINSFTQLLEKKLDDSLDLEAKEYMSFVREGACQMGNLVEDLMQYAQIQNRERTHKDVDLNTALSKSLSNLSDEIMMNNTTVESERLPTVKAHMPQMVCLFENLISNTIKFRSVRNPKLYISVTDEKDSHLIVLKDNGMGMSESACKKAFQLFKRIDNTDESKGTGVGLSICQQILFDMNGKIWIESKLGEGTSVFLRIPKKRESIGN